MNLDEFLISEMNDQVIYLLTLDENSLELYLQKIKVKNSRLSRQLTARLNTERQQNSISGVKENDSINNDSIKLIELDKIKPNTNQPRKLFDLTELVKLSEEIKITKQIIQPIKLNYSPQGNYEIVYGERRWRAYLLLRENFPLEYAKIPALIEYDMSSHKMQTEAIIENIARTDMSLVETAKSYKFLMQQGYMQKEIVDKSQNKSKSTVSRLIQISTLSNEVLDKIEEYKINSSNILEPLTKKDNNTKSFILSLEQQLSLLDMIKDGAKLKIIKDQISLWLNLKNSKTSITDEVLSDDIVSKYTNKANEMDTKNFQTTR